MTYLLDTCIISKLRKIKTSPNPQLSAWIAKHPETEYYISALTIGEIQAGIAKLNTHNKEEHKMRMALEEWLWGELIPRFGDRILGINNHTAYTWGNLSGKCKMRGINIPVSDGLIAATAIEYGLIVVTNNEKHFNETGAEVINPYLLS